MWAVAVTNFGLEFHTLLELSYSEIDKIIGFGLTFSQYTTPDYSRETAEDR